VVKLDPTGGICVFTDGSAYHKDRSGGWGWVALDAYEGIHTASGAAADVTINQMELYAPTHALYWLSQTLERACDVLVYSDSEYVVLGCQNPRRKRNKNREWWKTLDAAISIHNFVQFEHVRGHNDNLYNEMADDLAGKARKGKSK
jgi:ribonuclease HI